MKKQMLATAVMAVLAVGAQAQDVIADDGNTTEKRAAPVTKTVKVPATSNGNFGSCARNGLPLTKAISVAEAGTLVMTATGTWCPTPGYCEFGPDGAPPPWVDGNVQPLQQVVGISPGVAGGMNNYMALMGAFVPKKVVSTPGFKALDGTKINGLGVMPNQLFFVGKNNYLQVSGSGTLYLGVNDCGHDDNLGQLSVRVTFTPE